MGGCTVDLPCSEVGREASLLETGTLLRSAPFCSQILQLFCNPSYPLDPSGQLLVCGIQGLRLLPDIQRLVILLLPVMGDTYFNQMFYMRGHITRELLAELLKLLSIDPLFFQV